eukprot:5527387-Pleurochrysis_carterae.AAC.4
MALIPPSACSRAPPFAPDCAAARCRLNEKPSGVVAWLRREFAKCEEWNCADGRCVLRRPKKKPMAATLGA